MRFPERFNPRHLPRRIARFRVIIVRRASWKFALVASLGAMLAILGAVAVGEWSGHPLLLATFGPTGVLIFGFPQVPFAQPRNVLGGYLIAGLCGLAVTALLGSGPWAPIPAVGLAMFLMMLSQTVHPPAAGLPIVIAMSDPGWGFLGFPVMAGALLMVVAGLLFNRLGRQAERQERASRRGRRARAAKAPVRPPP